MKIKISYTVVLFIRKKIEYFLYCKIYYNINIKTNMNTKTIVKNTDSYYYTNDTASITGESMINYNNDGGGLIIITGGNVHQR